jgi:predicted transcriptional regulator
MPLDRVKKLAGELASHGLIAKRTDDPRIFVLTARGMEFLDAFDKLAVFLE